MTRNKLLCGLAATVILFVCTAWSAFAKPMPTKQQADSAYAKGDYQTAATTYETLLKQGASATVFYNLGNAYYRLNDLPKAVLNYERALKYEPAFADARYNLDVCRSKMSVPRDNATGMFFITWFKTLVYGQSVDFWGLLMLIALAATLLSWGAVHFLSQANWRRLFKFTACVCLVALCFSLSAALIQQDRFQSGRRAVLMTDTTLRSDEATDKKLMLVAGTAVEILDESPDGQLLVERTDGSVSGWVSSKVIVRI